MTLLRETLLQLIQGKYKITPAGWYSFNCPACMFNGEPSADTRKRGGLKISFSEEITFHCFRCQFKAHWRPGLLLSNKMKKLLSFLGLNNDDIQKLSFAIWEEKEKNFLSHNYSNQISFNFDKLQPIFNEIELPKGFNEFNYYIENNCFDKNFLEVINYLIKSRGENILKYYKFYWNPDEKYNKCVLIPFTSNNKIVGYTLRNISDEKTKYKYISKKPDNYLFLIDNLYNIKRKYVILVEGVFDAIAIDGVGLLGNNINQNQINFINSSNKEIILLPDRDKSGQKLVDIALENNWKVSFPLKKYIPITSYEENNKIFNCAWDDDIKDASDAVKKYGRIFTIKSIIDSADDNKLKIKLLQKYLIK